MLHKDISAKNIVLGKDGHYKFTDFGVSKVYDIYNTSITMAGTPVYFAPEFRKLYD